VLKQQKSFEVLSKGIPVAAFSSRKDVETFRRSASGALKVNLSDLSLRETDEAMVRLMASPLLADNEVHVYVKGHKIRLQINDDILA
jgi:hypothetical protein